MFSLFQIGLIVFAWPLSLAIASVATWHLHKTKRLSAAVTFAYLLIGSLLLPMPLTEVTKAFIVRLDYDHEPIRVSEMTSALNADFHECLKRLHLRMPDPPKPRIDSMANMWETVTLCQQGAGLAFLCAFVALTAMSFSSRTKQSS
jgi:hypothetical protein